MGYYVEIVESTAYIPAHLTALAYERMCELNKRNDLKLGGSWFGGEQREWWFSWMDPNYPETCKDAQEVLEQLGFEVSKMIEVGVDGFGLKIVGYDSKTGQEDLFLCVIKDLIHGKIKWEGEDGEKWVFTGSFNPKNPDRALKTKPSELIRKLPAK